MSNITNIYDAVITEVSGLFSTKTRIPNPYDLTNNPVNFIRDGWGLKVSGAAAVNGEICTITQNRTFTVIITKEVYRTDTNSTAIDDTAKDLLEDAKTLIEGMEAADQIQANSSISIINYAGSSDIALYGASKSHFLLLEVNFDIMYKENRI